MLGKPVVLPEIISRDVEIEQEGTSAAIPGAAPTPIPPRAEILGDVVEHNGYSLSAVTVDDPAAPDIDMSYEPAPNTRVVAVEMIVSCIACEELYVTVGSTDLVDVEGFVYQAERGMMADHEDLESTNLGPGERARGWTAFEIPEDAAPAYIKYQMDYETTLQAGLTE